MPLKFSVAVEPAGARLLDRQFSALQSNVKAYQKLARRLGGFVQRDAKANIRAQRTVAGSPFAPRQTGKSRKPMLRGLGQRIAVISMAGKGGGVAVTWRNGFEAHIGFRQQFGKGDTWTAQKARSVYGTPDYDAQCTERQARALLREGFKLPRKGKPPKRVTSKELQKMFTLGQAGLILRMMRTGKARGKQSWDDKGPARDFLGVTPERAEELTAKMAGSIIQATKQGNA